MKINFRKISVICLLILALLLSLTACGYQEQTVRRPSDKSKTSSAAEHTDSDSDEEPSDEDEAQNGDEDEDPSDEDGQSTGNKSSKSASRSSANSKNSKGNETTDSDNNDNNDNDDNNTGDNNETASNATGKTASNAASSSTDKTTSKTASSTSSKSSGNSDNSDVDVDSLIAGIGTSTRVYSKLSDAEKKALIAQAASEGAKIEFSSNGRMTVTGPEGEQYYQDSNGKWGFVDEDGNTGTIGSTWPDNQFTKQIPKPSFSIVVVAEAANEFSASFENVTVANAKAYASKLKSAGFTVSADEQEVNEGGLSYYLFSAANSSGYYLEMVCFENSISLVITK